MSRPYIYRADELARWTYNYYDMAHYIAAKWSKDPRRKVGAVLVGTDHRQISTGVNGLPPGWDDDLLLDRKQKNMWVLHAERNAIDRAQFDLMGSKLYVTSPPCTQCASSLVSAGVAHIFCPEPDYNSSWYEQQLASMKCGIRFTLIEDWKNPY